MKKIYKISISIITAILLIAVSIKSKKLVIAPSYKIEQQGLNDIVSNDLSDFEYSEFIHDNVNYFLNKWNLKGASIALVKDNKLIYAQGFGISDILGNKVEPGNLFRVASISKLITAVGIMSLVEDGKLTLDQKVFGPNGILNDSIFNDVKDRNIYKITVRQLLAHSAGWTKRHGDLAFSPLITAEIVGDKLPATIKTYYKYIANTNLRSFPGTSYSYSNMGYMILSDVITKVSNIEYEDYIREQILIPNGIYDMHIGKSFQINARANEVNYFEGFGNIQVPCFDGSGLVVNKSDGGNNIELLGAAGGWICSAVELARLITLIDGCDEVPDILTKSSIEEMSNNIATQGPLGWRTINGDGDWIRTGSMAGTVAMIKKMNNGYTWVFLSNSSNWKGNRLENNIDKLMTSIIAKVNKWPTHNLFDYYAIEEQNFAYIANGLND